MIARAKHKQTALIGFWEGPDLPPGLINSADFCECRCLSCAAVARAAGSPGDQATQPGRAIGRGIKYCVEPHRVALALGRSAGYLDVPSGGVSGSRANIRGRASRVNP